jgi:predicted PurR-regulated permease PerM
MISLIISTIVFFLAYFLLHQYLENRGLERGKARTLIVMTIASFIAYGAMALVDHFAGEPSLIDSVTKLEQQNDSL